MSDERLRELERRWKESGSVEDEAAYLAERVRVGELERERLRLAAYCGHEAARVALGEKAPQQPDHLGDLVRAMGTKEAKVRAAVAAANASFPVSQDNPNELEVMLRAVTAAEDWIYCPSASHGQNATNAGREALRTRLARQLEMVRAELEGLSSAALAALVTTPPRRRPSDDADSSIGRAAIAAGSEGPALESASVGSVIDAKDAVGNVAVRTAIRDELVPWALGYSDPVRERVEARQREAEG